MGGAGEMPRATARPGAAAVVFGAAVELFSLTTSLPWPVALTIGGAGVVSAVLLRTSGGAARTNTAILLALLVLGVLGATAPDDRLSGIAGGLAVLAVLVWVADEPGRVARGPLRALPAIGISGLALGVAWVSAFLLPPSPVPTGVAAALLVGVLLIVAALLGRPDLIENEPALAPG